MSKLSDRFKNTHEEIINNTYNIKCKCTDELKTLYNNEEIDPTMCLGKITHEYWNNFNCSEKPFLWSYDETTHDYTRNEETQNINNTTSVCLIKSDPHNISLNVGIDTSDENTTANSYKLITDIDYDNIVLAMSTSLWDKSGKYWLPEGNDLSYGNYAIIHVFYKVDKGNGIIELLDMERNVTLGIINDNKITCIESINYLNDDQYSLVTTSGTNSLNSSPVGRNINGNVFWHGNQERNAQNSSTSDAYLQVNRYMWAGTGYVREIKQVSRYKYLRDMLSSLGFRYILCDPATLTTENEFNNAVHLAYMDDQGVIDYTNILKTKDVIDSSDTHNKNISYDTIPQIDTNSYIDKIPLNENFFHFTSTAFTEMYALNYFDVINLKSDFENAPPGFDPLKSVVNMQSFPFEVTDKLTTHPIHIGGQSFGTDYKQMIETTRVLDLGQCMIPRYHHNFMDFSPYTDIKLYIPYCSEISISPSLSMGKKLSVKLIVDLATGQCVACVYCDSNIIAYSSGVIGSDIVVSNTGASLKSASMLQSMLGVGGSLVGLTGSVATGNPVGALGSAYGMITSVSTGLINENKNYSESKGSCTGYVNNIKPQFCYCVLTTVKPQIPGDFPHTVGYITNEYKQISQMNGYTVCENVDINGLSCHYESRERIKRILETGFYA